MGRFHRWGWLLLAAIGLVMGPGCHGKKASRVPSQAKSYTVRGEVVRGAKPEESGREILVQHEAIEDFVDRDGRVVGMATMIMPFEVEPSEAKKLAVGDIVELRFSVDWDRPSYRVEWVQKLPAGTPLDFAARGLAGGHAAH
ncbi:MAG TPA: hypothetical protein VMK12_16805 [Anaeromyxobacteraceae bacterium]|nr:hypothetical protein [Anaeromyxobacteraceae bacterium]